MRTELQLSIEETGWTNLRNAAYLEDFDALDRLVVEYIKLPYSDETKLAMIWKDVYCWLAQEMNKGEGNIQHPVASLNWFRLPTE